MDKIQWEMGTAFDLFVSLCVLTDQEGMDCGRHGRQGCVLGWQQRIEDLLSRLSRLFGCRLRG